MFRNSATMNGREVAVGHTMKVDTAGGGEMRLAEAQPDGWQTLADEHAVDTVLEDSFPASDPPSWTSGITRPEPSSESAAASAELA
jgi:hypothetical protein